MNKETNTGVSNRSLILLGALAALTLNRDARTRLVGGTRNALEGAHVALDETIKPALGTAATQAQDLAHVAAQRSANTLGTIREEGTGRAQAMLHTAVEAAGHLAETVQERAGHLAEDAGQKTKKRRQQATRALKSTRKDLGHTLHGARETGLGVVAGVQEGVQHLFHDAGDDVAAGRKQAQRRLADARRDAEEDLRRSGRKWKEAQLERAVNKRIAPLHKQTRRELARLDKEAMKQYKASSGHGGLGSTLTTVALVGTGIVVLARVPSVRQSIFRAVESVNPEAAQSLRRASRNARDVIGSAWLDSIEENKQTPAPGTAASTQAGTTGGTWGASVEPGSPAAARTQAEQAQETAATSSTADGSHGESGKDQKQSN